ncbi:MAG: threonylcarbamoyl-AMP synthase [Gemmatales bacterium]|nr:MAG: threonylcarbamoyl-AMP synthase [Gemmatales bacterium]
MAALKTEVLKVDAVAPAFETVERAADVLRRGGLVAFPTETVYGLGANALDRSAVSAVFLAKGRPVNNPLIVHVAAVDQVKALVHDWPAAAQRLAETFWPGPLTLVVSRSSIVPDEVTAGRDTVAIRIPSHPVALALLGAAQTPIAAPSANRSSRLSPTSAAHVLRQLEGRIDLVLDAGPCPGGLESTVIDLTTNPPRLLRPGLIPPDRLRKVIGAIELPEDCPPPASNASDKSSAALPSPGMLPKHYAPLVPLECVEKEAERKVLYWRDRGQKVGWLTFSAPQDLGDMVIVSAMPGEPAACAHRLYGALHALETAGVDRIIAELPPHREEWLAVRDRLVRASRK